MGDLTAIVSNVERINTMDYRDIHPMGATAAPKGKWSNLIADPAYIAERKFDGSRYILQVLDSGCFLCSRRESVNGGMVNKTSNVPQIIKSAQDFVPKNTVLDGEIDLYDVREFTKVQGIMGSSPERAIELQEVPGSKLYYKVFDILYFNGIDLRTMPWYKRQEYLDKIFGTSAQKDFLVRVPAYKAVNKRPFLEAELKWGSEGIMLKHIESIYVEGKKPAKLWYKFKKTSTFDGIVTGYKPGKGKYAGMLGALQVKQYVNGVLEDVAWASGMTDAQRKEFKTKLDAGDTFIIEFEAQEAYGTKDRYRNPRFKRIREDKNPQECIYGEGNG